jgi:hypothetical protein
MNAFDTNKEKTTQLINIQFGFRFQGNQDPVTDVIYQD